jgi:hypothetical protein
VILIVKTIDGDEQALCNKLNQAHKSKDHEFTVHGLVIGSITLNRCHEHGAPGI